VPLDPPVLILRDARESLKKCSLTPLRGMDGIEFVDYHPERVVAAHGRVLLHPDGEELEPDDGQAGLLLIDCSWRRVPSLRRTVEGELRLRRLPPFQTAYPRRSRVFEDPARGLASVEALYAALFIMGAPRPELLDDYRWAQEFLELNPGLS
jgi:pre-rRNA-processing protein TSR3